MIIKKVDGLGIDLGDRWMRNQVYIGLKINILTINIDKINPLKSIIYCTPKKHR